MQSKTFLLKSKHINVGYFCGKIRDFIYNAVIFYKFKKNSSPILEVSDSGIFLLSLAKSNLCFNPVKIYSLFIDLPGFYVNQLINNTIYTVNNNKYTFIKQRWIKAKC